jgi:hypothetical protein
MDFLFCSQTPHGIKTFLKTTFEGMKILGNFTAVPNHITSYWRARAKAASLFAVMQVTNHAMEHYMASRNLADHTNKSDIDELLGTHESAPLPSSSSQGRQQSMRRAQKGKARIARANEGTAPPGGIDHAGANEGNQVLETCEGPAPLISSGTRSGWQAMRWNQTGKGHISQTSEGTNLIRDMPYNGSGRARRIRRLWD